MYLAAVLTLIERPVGFDSFYRDEKKDENEPQGEIHQEGFVRHLDGERVGQVRLAHRRHVPAVHAEAKPVTNGRRQRAAGLVRHRRVDVLGAQRRPVLGVNARLAGAF